LHRVTVISGKGGTGKTTISAMFTYFSSSDDVTIVDADVDAPNLHLLLQPEIIEEFPFYGMDRARIIKDKCTECGICAELCMFDAIKNTEKNTFEIDEMRCEGCALCYRACPEEAIQMCKVESGKIFISRTSFGIMVHALLNPGEENSGKLVTKVRERSKVIAEKNNSTWLIMDGAPGVGCPVIASLHGMDIAVIVTEPTLSAINDLERVNDLCRYFNIKSSVIINKSDLNPDLSDQIELYCENNDILLLGKIPFDRSIIEQNSELKFPFRGKAVEKIEDCWRNLNKILKMR